MQEYKKGNGMNGFIYDIPTRIYFGQDQLRHLGDELKKYGKRVLVAYGGGSIKKIGLYDKGADQRCRTLRGGAFRY